MIGAVAVSGGIDSFYTTHLVRKRGYNVVGIFGIFHNGFLNIKDEVVSKYKELGINCVVFDLREEFEERIISNFVEQYIKGKTPNPCCLCNKYIKFGLLKQKAMDNGCDFFSTGHYAKLIIQNNKISLYKGIDKNKDQSYFLSLVSKEDFYNVEFYLGDYKKKDVKNLVKDIGLVPPISQESQEICFIKKDYRSFLKKRGINLPGPGKIIGVWGDEVGVHKGLFNYTIGQRRGLGIPYKEPLYVVDKIVDENILVVGTKSDLLSDCCTIEDVNFLEGISNWPKEVFVKVNYNMKPQKASWEIQGQNEIKVYFEVKIPKPTPGQICCFYSEDLVLGGGIIKDEK